MHDLLALTPAGYLVMLRRNSTEPAAVAGDGSARFAAIAEGFAASQAQGLIAIVDGRPDPTWPLPWTFWREFAAHYLTTLCQMLPSSRMIDPIEPSDEADLSRLSLSISPCPARNTAASRCSGVSGATFMPGAASGSDDMGGPRWIPPGACAALASSHQVRPYGDAME